MTFDDALALILGWVGRDLSITILDHSSCGVIAVLSGQVHASHELTAEAATEDESVALPLDDDGGCTWYSTVRRSTERLEMRAAWR